jgi:hypothetical protein
MYMKADFDPVIAGTVDAIGYGQGLLLQTPFSSVDGPSRKAEVAVVRGGNMAPV